MRVVQAAVGPHERQWYLEQGRRQLNQRKEPGFREWLHSQMQLEDPVRG